MVQNYLPQCLCAIHVKYTSTECFNDKKECRNCKPLIILFSLRNISFIFYQNGERGILIYRTSDTHIPNPLLIDLPPPSDYPSEQSPFGSSQNLADTGGVSSGVEAPPPVAKKMTMMKRNPNRDNDPKKENSKKEKQSAEDREKAYAEARARIFGAEAEAAAATAAAALTINSSAALPGNASSSSSSNVPIKKSSSDNKLEKVVRSSAPRATSASPPPPPTVINSNSLQNNLTNSNNSTNSINNNNSNSNSSSSKKKSSSNNSSKKSNNVSDNNNTQISEKSIKSSSPSPPLLETTKSTSTTTTTASIAATSTSTATVDNSVNIINTKKKTVDPTTWKEKKFIGRDFLAERSDPDFSRRSVGGNSNINSNGNSNSNVNSSSNLNSNHRGSQNVQYVQPTQYRPEDQLLGMPNYQQGIHGQVQNLGSMVSGNVPYQGYPGPDPYQTAMYGQNNGMIPYLQNGHTFVQTSFMPLNHITPASPTQQQQQWQQGHAQGMMINQHQGRNI